MTEPLIRVEGLSKKFCRSLKKSLWYGLQDIGSEVLGRRHGHDGTLRPEEFWAVKDVHFELNRGECLGLIGHNGAGKTTLLRMLNGLIKPDQGRIELRGKVGALIALGAGFNPILSGRENIYVNASVLGMDKRKVDAKFDEIVEFAELAEAIDAPVQTYSSGMSVRLGFAIAAILIEPDILLLDEVLAVGDIGFAIKCLNAVRQLGTRSAIVFVSHNLTHVSRFCSRVMVMEQGQVLLDSPDPAEAIDRYNSLDRHEVLSSGTGEAEILDLALFAEGKTIDDSDVAIDSGAELTLRLEFRIQKGIEAANVVIMIWNNAAMPIQTFPICEAKDKGQEKEFSPGEYEIEIHLGRAELNSGKYSFVVAIRDADSSVILSRVQGLCPFQVTSHFNYWSASVSPRAPKSVSNCESG